MTKKILLTLLCIAAAVGLPAQTYTPATVPNVQLQDYRQFVSNPDGILSAAAVGEINRICLELKEKGLAEVAVIVLDAVETGDLDMFAFTMLNRWGVGKKGKDNGLVISVIKEQRDIQFQTGYGLEGVLPDALCKRIQTVYMIPPLQAGDWDNGILEGVKALYNVLTDNSEELGALYASADADPWGDHPGRVFVFIVIFGIIFVIALIMAHRRAGSGGNDSDDTFRGGRPGGFGGFSRGGFGGGGLGGGFGGGRSGGGGARSGF